VFRRRDRGSGGDPQRSADPPVPRRPPAGGRAPHPGDGRVGLAQSGRSHAGPAQGELPGAPVGRQSQGTALHRPDGEDPGRTRLVLGAFREPGPGLDPGPRQSVRQGHLGRRHRAAADDLRPEPVGPARRDGETGPIRQRPAPDRTLRRGNAPSGTIHQPIPRAGPRDLETGHQDRAGHTEAEPAGGSGESLPVEPTDPGVPAALGGPTPPVAGADPVAGILGLFPDQDDATPAGIPAGVEDLFGEGVGSGIVPSLGSGKDPQDGARGRRRRTDVGGQGAVTATDTGRRVTERFSRPETVMGFSVQREEDADRRPTARDRRAILRDAAQRCTTFR